MQQALTGTYPAVLVEAFASSPCRGNGAAVVLLDEPLDDHWLQGLARSLNQSETAFLLRLDERWLLRWFTPSCEVRLCGHATLAATVALGHWHLLAPQQPCTLHSLSGPLSVEWLEDGASIVLPSGGLIPLAMGDSLQAYLHRQLGVSASAGWNSALGYTVLLLPPETPLAEADLAPESLPREVAAGLVLMQPLPPSTAQQVLGRTCDYQLRFMAPALGIPEDPVAGSAHALVAPWWLDRLDRAEVVGWQCSDRPGGMVCSRTSSGMIRLTGTSHLLWDGTMRLGGWQQQSPQDGDGGSGHGWRSL